MQSGSNSVRLDGALGSLLVRHPLRVDLRFREHVAPEHVAPETGGEKSPHAPSVCIGEQHQGKSKLLLDMVVKKRAPTLQLPPRKEEPPM